MKFYQDMAQIHRDVAKIDRAIMRSYRHDFWKAVFRWTNFAAWVLGWAFLVFAALYLLIRIVIMPVNAEVIKPIERAIKIATVTAYTSSVDETDDTPFITASGATTRRGIIACPSKYPFGTIIELDGVRYECQDRMNRRYRNDEHFDVWVGSKNEAFNWGVKSMEIVVVSPEV